MRTALDAPSEALDPSETNFVSKVREYGWFRTGVLGEGSNPGFSFTTGFWTSAQHPELIMFSTKADIAHDVFWDLFREAKVGNPLNVGIATSQVFANLPAYAFPVAKRFYADHLGWSRWFYGNDAFPCLQIVWSDRAGLFPWQSGFDPTFSKDQPDLTENGWQAALAH